MSDDKMTEPVTRGELIEILSDYPTKKDLSEALSDYATKTDLDTWGGALSARIGHVEQRLDGVEQRLDGVEQRLDGVVQRLDGVVQTIRETSQTLLNELRRHTTANAEDLRTQVSVIDEQYRELPARVTRLEATVFAPKKRATRRAARGRRP